MLEFSEPPTKLQVLRASTLLNSISDEDIVELAAFSSMAFAERRTTIWLNGAAMDFFAIVGVGFVKMMRSSSSGQDVTTELMGPGQVFGLLGVIDGSGCPQIAQAICNTWYLKVNKRAFLEVYRENTILKEHLLRRTVGRLRGSFEMVTRMSTGKVDERIAAILFILSDSYGVANGDGIVLEVPLTRQDIAEMAGTTVESAIRTLSSWQKKNLISTSHKQITILDPDQLQKIL